MSALARFRKAVRPFEWFGLRRKTVRRVAGVHSSIFGNLLVLILLTPAMSPAEAAYQPSDPNLFQPGRDILNSFKKYEGQYWLTGQNEDNWTLSHINNNSDKVGYYTGKYPAIRGFDLDPWRYTRPNDLASMINSWNTARVIPNIAVHAAPWGDRWDTMDDRVDISKYLKAGTREKIVS